MIENRKIQILNFTSKELADIQEYIRELMPVYNQIMVRKIVALVRKEEGGKKNLIPRDERMSKFESVYIDVHGDGQHYCLNKGEEHASSTIYFQIINKNIGEGFLYQRCSSPKSYNSELCRNYVHPKDGELIHDEPLLIIVSIRKNESLFNRCTGE